MNLKHLFHELTRFEKILWLSSVITVAISFLLCSENCLTLIASLIGVTALIFVAKGHVAGQILTVIFSVFYGIISFYFHYYGGMITYLGMTAPIAVFSVISWIKHPFQDSSEVTVNKINRKQILLLIVLTITVTVIFYYILAALGNKNLTFSTISITTSFLASSLAFLRSPYYAIAYAANDIILIILWTLAALDDSGYIPMVICFVIFFINDIYGFLNWQQMYKKQNKYKPDNCV